MVVSCLQLNFCDVGQEQMYLTSGPLSADLEEVLGVLVT